MNLVGQHIYLMPTLETSVSEQVDLALVVHQSEPVHKFFGTDAFLDFYREPYRQVNIDEVKTVLRSYGPGNFTIIMKQIPQVLSKHGDGPASSILMATLEHLMYPFRI